MLSTRNFMSSKSKFYRGISLQEYIRKDSLLNDGLRYKDDQTIFLDQDKMPVLVDDSINFVVSRSNSTGSRQNHRQNLNPKQLLKPRLNIDLPTLTMSKGQFLKSKSLNTDRNSTDASQSNQTEVKPLVLLPAINKKSVIRQRNITMTSRSSSRQTSCRKKVPTTLLEVEQFKEEDMKIDRSIFDNGVVAKQQQKRAKCQINLRRHLYRNDSKNSYFDNSKLFFK